jgi:hypothetical protein
VFGKRATTPCPAARGATSWTAGRATTGSTATQGLNEIVREEGRTRSCSGRGPLGRPRRLRPLRRHAPHRRHRRAFGNHLPAARQQRHHRRVLRRGGHPLEYGGSDILLYDVRPGELDNGNVLIG